MQDEELFVGGYIIRKLDDEDNFDIENTLTGETRTVSERYFTKLLDDLWRFLEA